MNAEYIKELDCDIIKNEFNQVVKDVLIIANKNELNSLKNCFIEISKQNGTYYNVIELDPDNSNALNEYLEKKQVSYMILGKDLPNEDRVNLAKNITEQSPDTSVILFYHKQESSEDLLKKFETSTLLNTNIDYFISTPIEKDQIESALNISSQRNIKRKVLRKALHKWEKFINESTTQRRRE